MAQGRSAGVPQLGKLGQRAEEPVHSSADKNVKNENRGKDIREENPTGRKAEHPLRCPRAAGPWCAVQQDGFARVD